jgi:hypothetical protein
MSTRPITTNSIKIINEKGNPVYFERISITDNKNKNWCRVRCSCSDFKHRFAWEDRDVNALFGAPPAKYTPVPGSNRPPVNPEHIPGMCKHIFGCAKGLEHYFMR